jgi:hypothetical protein
MIDPKAVAFDIDGVVADTMNLFIHIAREDYQIEVRYQDMTRYMLEECLSLEGEIVGEIIGKLLDGSYDDHLNPLPGARDVLARLDKSYGPLCFVTARPNKGTIRDWMNKALPVDPSRIDIVATGSFEAKKDVLVEKGISYFVEDRLETCFQLKEAGITPVLFKQPWNREEHPFIEVGSWHELESLIAF